jgi:hypothetical protein
MKYILIGLIVVLIGALWFLMPTREGLDNPTCWEDVLDASTGKFVNMAEAALSIRKKYQMTLNEAKTVCAADPSCIGIVSGSGPGGATVYSSYSGSPTIVPVDVAPLPAPGKIMFYAKKPCQSLVTSPPQAPGCPTGGEGVTSVKQSGGQNVRLYTQSECTKLNGTWVGNGARDWGMKTDKVGECYGTPGVNLSFCNQTAPPSPVAAVEAGIPPPAAPLPMNPPAPPPAPAPAPAPAPPPAPAPAPPTADPQIGTLINLLQQDIASRQSSLLNTANNPAVPVGSLLNQTTVDPNWKPVQNATIPGPNFSATRSLGPLDNVPKSSLVPCTCPTYTMSCPIHVGSMESSVVPGDTISALAKAQDQYDIMRPFNNTAEDVPGFLTTFSAFG